MRTLLILPLLLFVPSLHAQEPSQQHSQLPSVELPPEIDRVLRDYERGWRGRDPAGLASLFSHDGFVLPSGGPPVRGRAAIEERYAGAGGNLALRALAFAVADTVGYIIGAYAWERDGPDAGKFVLALKKDESGRWLIAADIDNSNQR